METWTLDWAIRNFLAELLMPPGIWLLSVAIILFLFKKLQPFQKSLIFLFLGLIWLSATPIFTHALITISQSWMNWPQAFHLKDNNQLMSEQGVAIIVLGGGRRKGALESPEYHFQDLQKASMERLRVGAKLAHQTHLPILVSGGSPDQTHQNDWSEAKVMAKILENEFNLQPKWIEGKSHTTLENAQYSAEILKAENIKNIYLVTHFWHMPRAQMVFEQSGFKVMPVPHGYRAVDLKNPLNYFPNSMETTREVWHEILGMIWYRLRY